MQRRNITLNMTRFVKVKISTETYRLIQSNDQFLTTIMTERLESFFQDAMIEKLTKEFSHLESFIKHILHERQNYTAEIERLQNERRISDAKNTKLAEILTKSREVIEERDEEIKKLRTVTKEYERQLENSGHEFDLKCEQNNSLTSQLSKLKEENQNLLDQVVIQTSVKEEPQYFDVRPSDTTAQLEVELHQEKDRVRTLEGQLTLLDTEISHLRQTCQAQTDTISKLGVSIENNTKMFDRLMRRKQEYKRKAVRTKKDFAKYKDKIQRSLQLGNNIQQLKHLDDSDVMRNSQSEAVNGNSMGAKQNSYEGFMQTKENLEKIRKFKVPKYTLKETSSSDSTTEEKKTLKSCYNLFVANVSHDVDSLQLKELFSPFSVETLELKKGCALIRFKSKADAVKAKEKIDKMYFHGRQLSVSWSNGKK